MSKNEITIQYKVVNSEFNSGISEINSEVKKLNKEFKLQQEQMKYSSDETEKLEARVEHLKKTQELAAQKTKETSDAYENAKKLLGENSKEAQNWANKLLDAKKSEEFLKNQIIDTNRRLEESKEKTSESAKASEKKKQAIAELQKEQEKLGLESQKLNSELKLEKSAMSSSATEAEKLEFAKKGLSKQSTLVAKQIENLEKQLELSKSEYGENSKEVLKLETALNESKSAFNKLENEIKETADTSKEAGHNFDEMTRYLKVDLVLDFAEHLGNLSQKLVDIGKSSLEAFKEVDEGMDIIITKTGASGESLENMQGIAKNISYDLPASFSEIGNAVGEVNTQFGLIEEDLEETSKTFLKFASINGTDVTQSIINSKKAMESYNLTALDLDHILDSVTYVAQATGQSVDEIFKKTVEGAPQIEALGLKFDEAALLIGNFEKNGIDSAVAMKSLSKAYVNFAKDGKSLSEGLQETITKIKDSKSETEALSLASEVFGTKAAPLMYKAIKSGKLDFDALKKSAEESGGVVSKTFESTLDPIDRFTTTQNAAKNLMSEFGSIIASTFAPSLDLISVLFKNLAEWISSLPEPLQNFIAIFGGLITVAGLLAPIFLGLSAAATAMGMSIGGMLLAFAPIAGTILGIIAVIAALTAGIKYLWENNETFRTKVIEIWTAIQEFLTPIIQSISDFIIGIWDNLSSWWTTNQELIKTTAETVWNGIKSIIEIVMSILGPFIQTAWENIKIVIETVWNVIKNNVETVINVILGIIRAVMQLITGDWSGAWETIKGIVDTIINAISNNISTVFNGIKNIISNIWESIKSTINSTLESIKGTFYGTLDSLSTKANTIWESIKSTFRTAIDTVKNLFNFQFKWPHIPLPHFSISGSANPLDWISQGVPKLSVSWYAKGGIMKNPTLFGMNGSNMMVGGEAGPEAILPLNEKTLGTIGKSIFDYSKFGELMKEVSSESRIIINMNNQISSDYDVNKMVDIIEEKLVRKQGRKLFSKGGIKI